MLAYRNPRLEPKQIGDCDKELPAVIDIASTSASDGPCVGIEHQVLQVAIVANVDRGSRMQEVGNEKIPVEVPGGVSRTQGRLGQRCCVLQDQVEGKLAVELPMPVTGQNIVA